MYLCTTTSIIHPLPNYLPFTPPTPSSTTLSPLGVPTSGVLTSPTNDGDSTTAGRASLPARSCDPSSNSHAGRQTLSALGSSLRSSGFGNVLWVEPSEV